MKRYLGVKEINARPMTRGAYNHLRGWALPADEDGSDEGYLVEYIDGGPPNVIGYKGYVSWSPKDVFDRAYHPIVGLSFGQAIEAMKQGAKVSRQGWNGKGMFLYHVPANSYPAERNTNKTLAGVFPGDLVPYGAYIAMKTAQNNVVPWLASQTDMLAEDWEIQP